MPDLPQWALLLAVGLVAVGVAAWPPLRRGATDAATIETRAEAEARALRHRLALDALIDLEADRRAGSLDEAAYQRQLDEAEARAAQTLDEATAGHPMVAAGSLPGGGRRIAAWLAGLVAVALLVGFALPAPVGLAERTVVNQGLADAIAREDARQAEIQRLLGALSTDPHNTSVLSDLADAYLAGDSTQDLQRAAVSLQVLLAVDPQNRSAYQRLITAYISAADWTDALGATDSYEALVGSTDPNVPFFRGVIVFRQGQNSAAVRYFDDFLRLAPDDGRVAMVTSLRAEAAGELPGASASPGG